MQALYVLGWTAARAGHASAHQPAEVPQVPLHPVWEGLSPSEKLGRSIYGLDETFAYSGSAAMQLACAMASTPAASRPLQAMLK